MLAAVCELFAECSVKEHDGLAAGHAELGAAEGKHVNACFPREFSGFHSQRCDRVCEAGTIHMELEPDAFADVAELSNFGWGVDRAEFGGTAEGEGLRLREMDVAPLGGDFFDGIGIKFTEGARCGEEFGAVREELGCAAFIGFDVRSLVGDDAVVGLAQTCEGEGVGSGSIENEVNVAVGFEKFAERVGCISGERVVAVGRNAARIGGNDCFEDFGAGSGGVVACERVVEGAAAHGASVEREWVLGKQGSHSSDGGGDFTKKARPSGRAREGRPPEISGLVEST
ncbi:MAG: hypothetical protein RIS92_1466 [Verrucomicrobiota bacterium]